MSYPPDMPNEDDLEAALLDVARQFGQCEFVTDSGRCIAVAGHWGGHCPPPCSRTFEMLGHGNVRVHYSCGVEVVFQNLPPWPANHDIMEARLPGRSHPHARAAATLAEMESFHA